MKQIARIRRRRLSEVLRESIDGLTLSMMNSCTTMTFIHMKMCTNNAILRDHNISIR